VAEGPEGEEGVDSALAARAARRLQVSAASRRTQVLGLQIDVDTSAAGFTTSPYYMAWLEGDLWDPALIGRFADGALDERDRTGRAGTGVLDWQRALLRLAEGLFQVELLQLRFGHIYRPTPTGFTYRVWFPHLAKWNGSRAPFDFLLLMAHRSQFSVAWLGVAESSRTGS
jgi:hypothetical protein